MVELFWDDTWFGRMDTQLSGMIVRWYLRGNLRLDPSQSDGGTIGMSETLYGSWGSSIKRPEHFQTHLDSSGIRQYEYVTVTAISSVFESDFALPAIILVELVKQ